MAHAAPSIQHDSVAVKHVAFKTSHARLLVVGDSTSGKTALIRVFSGGSAAFPRQYVPTLHPDVSNRVVRVGSSQQVDLLVYDWPGGAYLNTKPLDPGSFGARAIEQADAILLVFDVTSRDSFASVAKWHRRVVDSSASRHVGALVGTRTDLRTSRGVVSAAEAAALAAQLGVPYFETSAEAALGVEAPFLHVAAEVCRAAAEGE